MTRRCSYCSHNGHNSRTCPNRGVKLFGVRLTDDSIRKSASMGNLTHYTGSSSNSTPPPQNGLAHDYSIETPDDDAIADGYASEDFVPGSSSSHERKKGVPWTEQEHRMFLLGLQKVGKGDWRGIARNYVISRTPTQVASHAQKYFIRQSHMSRRKRRPSLFDIVADKSNETPTMSQDLFVAGAPQAETENNPTSPAAEEECESMDFVNSSNSEPVLPKPDSPNSSYPVASPTYLAPFSPFPFPSLTGYSMEPTKTESHEVLKPTAVHSKSPLNVDELVGISKLSLGESLGDTGPSSLSLKLVEGSNRQSAFHANPTSAMTDYVVPFDKSSMKCGIWEDQTLIERVTRFSFIGRVDNQVNTNQPRSSGNNSLLGLPHQKINSFSAPLQKDKGTKIVIDDTRRTSSIQCKSFEHVTIHCPTKSLVIDDFYIAARVDSPKVYSVDTVIDEGPTVSEIEISSPRTKFGEILNTGQEADELYKVAKIPSDIHKPKQSPISTGSNEEDFGKGLPFAVDKILKDKSNVSENIELRESFDTVDDLGTIEQENVRDIDIETLIYEPNIEDFDDLDENGEPIEDFDDLVENGEPNIEDFTDLDDNDKMTLDDSTFVINSTCAEN